MMQMAFLLRPWVLQMRALRVKPRLLADDMFLEAEGEDADEDLNNAVDETHGHIEDMLAEANMDKSGVMSSDARLRSRLCKRLWGMRRERVKVMRDTRDLGAHLNTVKATRNGTMARRCRDALPLVKRLKVMPATRAQKKVLVLGKIYPMALYGGEVISAPTKQMGQLATAVADVFYPRHATRRSQDLFWAVGCQALSTP